MAKLLGPYHDTCHEGEAQSIPLSNIAVSLLDAANLFFRTIQMVVAHQALYSSQRLN